MRVPRGPIVTLLRIAAGELAVMDPHSLESLLRQRSLYQAIARNKNGGLAAKRISPGDASAWRESVIELAHVLVDADRPYLEVLIEYQVPHVFRDGNAIRVDAVACGMHRKSGEPAYLLVELKRWENIKSIPSVLERVLVEDMNGKHKDHPAFQISRNKKILKDQVLAVVEPDVSCTAIAYLHNASAKKVGWLKELATEPRASVYLREDRDDLVALVRTQFARDPGSPAAETLHRSPCRSDAALTTQAVPEILAGRRPFELTRFQEDAVEQILGIAKDGAPAVAFVEGGPGSGKSIVLLESLYRLAVERDFDVCFVTASSSYREAIEEQIRRHGLDRLRDKISVTNKLSTAGRTFDVVLFDEAQRMREWPKTTMTTAERTNENRSVNILLRSARVLVFAMDTIQVIRAEEQGDLARLRGRARGDLKQKLRLYEAELEAKGAPKRADLRREPIDIVLHRRFRAGGTGNYETWIERLLRKDSPGPIGWLPDERYILRVAGSPQEMQAFLESRIKEHDRARMTAGFCWDWSKDGHLDATGRRTDHIHIETEAGLWSYPWNAHTKTATAPASVRWAIDDEYGFGQIGCVYTCHGLEFDWVGVIIGPDLVWRDGAWLARRSEHRDRTTVRGAAAGLTGEAKARALDARFDELVRNIYRILLSRGLRGTVLYSPDKETRDILTRLVAGETPSSTPVL
jgi:DUF2075 family protein